MGHKGAFKTQKVFSQFSLPYRDALAPSSGALGEGNKTVPQSGAGVVVLSAKHWSEWQDLNLRPLVPDFTPLRVGELVGAVGIEPTTSRV